MKHFNLILLGVLFIFFQSCFNTANNKTISENLTTNHCEFFGEWLSIERDYPFDATLKIDSNYYFTYEGGACVSRFSSNGYWVLDNDTLILNSNKPEDCCYLSNFGVNCLTIKINDSVILKRGTSIKDCVPEQINYEFIFFENEKFIINNGFLMHIQKPNNLCPNIKDDFTRKNATDKNH